MERSPHTSLSCMKQWLFLLCFLPLPGYSQPGEDLYLPDMEPVAPDMPVGAFDLNGDSIPELTFSHYVVGTDDVPSSSGSWTIVVVAEEHCEILYNNSTGSGWAESLYWLQPKDTVPHHSSGSMIWQARGAVEFLYMGYGGSATDGWVRSYQDVSDRIAVRFTQGDEIWMGWIQWELNPLAGTVKVDDGEVWVVE